MTFLDKKDVNQYSPLTLAFLGDAVYEQLVREKIVLTANMPVGRLHKEAVERVRAAYQSRAVDVILPMLTEDEENIIEKSSFIEFKIISVKFICSSIIRL